MRFEIGNALGKVPGPLRKRFLGYANDGASRYNRSLVLFELQKRPENVIRMGSVPVGVVGVNAESFPNPSANIWKSPEGCDDKSRFFRSQGPSEVEVSDCPVHVHAGMGEEVRRRWLCGYLHGGCRCFGARNNARGSP